jgi:hypothetical protein
MNDIQSNNDERKPDQISLIRLTTHDLRILTKVLLRLTNSPSQLDEQEWTDLLGEPIGDAQRLFAMLEEELRSKTEALQHQSVASLTALRLKKIA